jgi:hypothetical protein
MSFSHVTEPFIQQKWNENAHIFRSPLKAESKHRTTAASAAVLSSTDKLPELAGTKGLEVASVPGKWMVPSAVAAQRIQATKKLVKTNHIAESPSPDAKARSTWTFVPGLSVKRRTLM